VGYTSVKRAEAIRLRGTGGGGALIHCFGLQVALSLVPSATPVSRAGSMDDLYNLELLSTVNKITQEILNHTGRPTSLGLVISSLTQPN
jgi:hypothetical protein